MLETMKNTITGLELGEVQTFRNAAVFPIFAKEAHGPAYITLGEALKRSMLTISETSEDGSVPEVKVVNAGEVFVLLLDGEELVGAKQNRVLNSTVLLTPKSETVINVSCTERGRWSYRSREFADSDVVMARNIRARKSRSVSASLRESNQFRSDQGEIWEEIDVLGESAGVCSETAAMRDIFAGKENHLKECLDRFAKIQDQVGLIFVVDSVVVGMDLVSRSDAYSDLHNRLVRSYAIDSMLENQSEGKPGSVESVEQFVSKLVGCSESSFPSVGCGTDYRYENRDVCGSALVHEDTCIHAAFFSNVASEEHGPQLRGFRQRRRFRRQ